MKMKKLTEVIILLVFMGVLLGLSWMPAKERDSTDRSGSLYTEEKDHWGTLLLKETEREDFVLAAALIGEDGAELSWDFYDNREELLDGLSRKTEADTDTGKEGHSLLFLKMKKEELFGTDVFNWLLENRNEEGYDYSAWTDEKGEGYYIVQEWHEANERGVAPEKSDIVMKDDCLYLIECTNVTDGNREEISELLDKFVAGILPFSFSGWGLDEERLYWADHDRRETKLDGPERQFTEIRAKNITWPHPIMGNFGLLTEAHYQVRFSDTLPEMTVSFYLAEEILKEGYEDYLFNGYSMNEPYRMVSMAEDGSTLQEAEVDLCIEKTDTVSFVDLDGDGYLDMIIEYPVHDSNRLLPYKCWLFNPEKLLLEPAETEEILKRRNTVNQPQSESAPDKIRVARGDCLWSIAERYYGDGRYSREIYEKNRSLIGNDPSFITEGMELIMP